MYVHPSARSLGISKLILEELERHVKDVLELDAVVLEVGLRQEPAVRLYEGAGYVGRSMFGEYMGADVASGGDSVCLEKRLKEFQSPGAFVALEGWQSYTLMRRRTSLGYCA